MMHHIYNYYVITTMPYNSAGGCLELIDSRVALGRDYRPAKSWLL